MITVLSRAVIAAAVFSGSIASAAESIGSTSEQTPIEKILTNKWTGDAGVNFVNAYYAYGILQEGEGLIAQPFADVYWTLFEGRGLITKATVGIQLWSSFHSKRTGAAQDSSIHEWYEQDVNVPFALTLGERVTLTISYLEYHFRNGAFELERSVSANLSHNDSRNGALDLERSVSVNLSYDDSKWFGACALHPHIMLLYNFEGVVGIAQSNAWYFEAGIAPGLTLAEKSRWPVTVSLPVILGLGDNHFYRDDAFGYLSAGASVSVPLAFVPESFGHWRGNASAIYQIFGRGTAAANLERQSYVVQTGITWEF